MAATHFLLNSSGTTTLTFLFVLCHFSAPVSTSLQAMEEGAFTDPVEDYREKLEYDEKISKVVRLLALMMEQRDERFPAPRDRYEQIADAENYEEFPDNSRGVPSSISSAAKQHKPPSSPLAAATFDLSSAPDAGKDDPGYSRLKSLLMRMESEKQLSNQIQNGGDRRLSDVSSDVLPIVPSKRGRMGLQGAMPPMNEFCRMMRVSC